MTFKPTEQMAKNAKRALEVRAKKPPSQQGMTSVGLARARQLIARQPLSLSTVKRMASFFARHEVDKQGATWAEHGKGWQAWMGWGGDAGKSWANAIVKSSAKTNPDVDSELHDLAHRLIYHLRSNWDLGGDMGHENGFVFLHDGKHYAVRIELWGPECVPTVREAVAAGRKLAKRWSKEHWPVVGYLDLGGLDEKYGASYAIAPATQQEVEDTEDPVELPVENPSRGVPLAIGMVMPELVAAAQRVYDEWDEADEDLGGGGICDLIADEFVTVLADAGIEAKTVLQGHGEQHIFTLAVVPAGEPGAGVYSIDIAPSRYEEGSMFSWRKLPDVAFDENDIDVELLDKDPNTFDEYGE